MKTTFGNSAIFGSSCYKGSFFSYSYTSSSGLLVTSSTYYLAYTVFLFAEKSGYLVISGGKKGDFRNLSELV